MFDLDTRFFQVINNLAGKSALWDRAFIFASDYAIWVFAAVLVWLFFYRRKLFWIALVSAIISRGILTELIRLLYQRPRPFAVLENVRQLVEKNGTEASFPSGHAAYLFAVALAVYLFNKKIGVILIVVALFFTFARIYTGIHYPLDILGGIAVAGLAVFLVRKLARSRY